MWETPVIEVIVPEPEISTCGGPGFNVGTGSNNQVACDHISCCS